MNNTIKLVLVLPFLLTGVAAMGESLPEMSFYRDGKLLSTRVMTAPEHQKYQALQQATEAMQPMQLPIAEMSAQISLHGEKISSLSEQLVVNVMADPAGYNGSELETQIESLAAIIESHAAEMEVEAASLEAFGNKVEKAADEFQREVERNSGDLDYDQVDLDGEHILIDT